MAFTYQELQNKNYLKIMFMKTWFKNKENLFNFTLLILDLSFIISLLITFLIYIIPLFLQNNIKPNSSENKPLSSQDNIALASIIYAFIYFFVRHRFNKKLLKFEKQRWEEEKKLRLLNHLKNLSELSSEQTKKYQKLLTKKITPKSTTQENN